MVQFCTKSAILFTIVVVALAMTGCCNAFTPGKPLPAKFLGSWTVDHSDNFDEYLEAKGYGWFMRQVVKLASITKIFTLKGNGLYNCKILTTKKNVEWDNWELEKEFQAEYLDDTQHLITIRYDQVNDQMVERHQVVGDDSKPVDVYTYKVNPEGWLVMRMDFNGVATSRYYKKNVDPAAATGGEQKDGK